MSGEKVGCTVPAAEVEGVGAECPSMGSDGGGAIGTVYGKK